MNTGVAQWWTNPDMKDDTPVVAHTPDPTRYHYPDQRQNERMRYGISGVVIPRANNDGTSKGFDGRVAGMVHVDPDAPDGGAVVDLSTMDPSRLYDAFSHSQYPHEVYYNLKAAPSVAQQYTQEHHPPPQVVQRDNSMVPSGSYIVPAAKDDGTQIVGGYSVDPVPPLPGQQQQHYPPQQPQQPPQQQQAPVPPQQPQQVTAPAPAPQQAPVPPQQPQQAQQPYYPQQPQQPVYQQPQAVAPVTQPAAPQQDPFAGMSAQIAQLTNAVGMMLHHQQSQQAPVPPVSAPNNHMPQQQVSQPQLATVPNGPRPGYNQQQPTRHPPQPSQPPPRHAQLPLDDEEDFEPKQTLRQMQAAVEEPADGIIMGFEALEMNFVKGPLPEKAKREVFFEIPNMGTMSARYHAVSDGGACVALVYDTRYEDGTQFLPPDLGDQELVVQVPKLKKKWVCSSMGLHFNVGVLDIIVLIKHRDADDPYEDDDED